MQKQVGNRTVDHGFMSTTADDYPPKPLQKAGVGFNLQLGKRTHLTALVATEYISLSEIIP